MKDNIFPANLELDNLDYLYTILLERSHGLNEFKGRIKNEISEKINWDRKKRLKITLDYLSPLLKSGKLEVRIWEQFEWKASFWKFYNCIKTKALKERLWKILRNYEEIRKTENGPLTKKFFSEEEIKKEEDFWIARYPKWVCFWKTYLPEEIETFKEDITNILFNYCETDRERQNFEEFNIWFRLPWTCWELV